MTGRVWIYPVTDNMNAFKTVCACSPFILKPMMERSNAGFLLCCWRSEFLSVNQVGHSNVDAFTFAVTAAFTVWHRRFLPSPHHQRASRTPVEVSTETSIVLETFGVNRATVFCFACTAYTRRVLAAIRPFTVGNALAVAFSMSLTALRKFISCFAPLVVDFENVIFQENRRFIVGAATFFPFPLAPRFPTLVGRC
jgi:hypothetical protein